MTGIGASERRIEDRPLLTGSGRFAADISFPDQLHMCVVRSEVAFGRLVAVHAEEAMAADGVVAVWTHADIAELPPIDFRQVEVEVLKDYRQYLMASDRVRYVGEPVAVVFASEAALAEDAADLVCAEIEGETPDIRATDPPGLFAPGLMNDPVVIEKACGDLDAAFACGLKVVEREYAVARHSGVPLETRGLIARRNPSSGVLEVYGAAKIPHINRVNLAAMLGLDLKSIHLYEGHVGGGFGIRGEIYPEDVLVCLAALRLDFPIKWIEDRREHLIAANHSRDQVYRLRAAVDDDGVIHGLDAEFWHDQGAYVRTHAATVPDLSAAMLPGPYRVPDYRARGHIRLTNKTPAGTYRAPGRYESTFARERLIDAIAAELCLDPSAVRRANFIAREAIPFNRGLATLGIEVIYDAADFAGLLDRFETHFAIAKLKADLAQRRDAGQLAGFGYGYFVEKSGLGPFGLARVVLLDGGAIEIVTGAASVGQGIETALAQVCAEILPLDLASIAVIHGQTDRIAEGRGAFASRVTVMTGSAVHMAAVKLREAMLAIAARVLQQPADALVIDDGRVVTRDATAGPSMTFAEIANAADDRASLAFEERFLTDHMTYPYGIHGAVVLVDAETGGVSVERVLVAYDIGRAVNPMLVEGQIAGGVAQGLGGALLEAFVYDETGQPLAATFADYLIPTANEVPPIEILITEDAPSPLNPLGVKGAGEAGINAMGAAIAAAIDDAIGRPGAVTSLPVTPMVLREILRGYDTAK